MAQRFSLEKLALEGPAEPVSPDVAPRFLSARAEFSAPVNARTLAFVSPLEGQPGTLTWFDRSGQPDRQLQASPDTEYLNPAISPDGTRVAGNLFDPLTGNLDVWVVDVAREITSRLTFGPSQDADPV